MQYILVLFALCLFLNTTGQIDMPVEGLEATIKAITLIEDFTSFDAQLPDQRYRPLFEIFKDAKH